MYAKVRLCVIFVTRVIHTVVVVFICTISVVFDSVPNGEIACAQEKNSDCERNWM